MPTHSLYGGRVRVDFEEVGHAYTVWVDGAELGPRDSVTKILKAVDMGKSDAFAWWGAEQALGYLERTWPVNSDGAFGQVGPDQRAELFYAAQRAHIETRDTAASIGKAVHAWLEAHINAKIAFGEEPALPSDPQTLNAVMAYLSHEAEHHVEYQDNERVVYSLAHDYIGTLDHTRLLVVDGASALGDYKTSSDMRITFRLQTAAYAKAMMEENPERRITKRFIYLLGKDDAECRPVDLCYPGMTDKESLDFDYAGFLAAQQVYKWGLKAIEVQPKKKRKRR